MKNVTTSKTPRLEANRKALAITYKANLATKSANRKNYKSFDAAFVKDALIAAICTLIVKDKVAVTPVRTAAKMEFKKELLWLKSQGAIVDLGDVDGENASSFLKQPSKKLFARQAEGRTERKGQSKAKVTVIDEAAGAITANDDKNGKTIKKAKAAGYTLEPAGKKETEEELMTRFAAAVKDCSSFDDYMVQHAWLADNKLKLIHKISHAGIEPVKVGPSKKRKDKLALIYKVLNDNERIGGTVFEFFSTWFRIERA